VVEMTRFIPSDKLSKKAKRKLDKSKRQTWESVKPVTRKIESKKLYKRRKPSRWIDPDSMRVFCFYRFAIMQSASRNSR
jgi:hypothetical protein